ncbi:hypothetical protein AVEN_242920-1 [Araneus ventricosus]|uniref:Uncharacterized protein n=1 Tax=Araneus ventricosus TaxID=182803 RepID=A0A4Y2UQ39_ARAVE|nr:hypothetical protein AVEN_242920-1 [Araneus ventricosus]
MITSHGGFKTYLNRSFGKSPWCFCAKDEGTVEHTILKCDAWKDIRDTYFKKKSSSIKEGQPIKKRLPTEVPCHSFNYRMAAAIFIKVVSRYGKVTMRYWMKPLTAPPGVKRWS